MPDAFVRFQIDVPVTSQEEADNYPALKAKLMEHVENDQQINWIVNQHGEECDDFAKTQQD